MCSYLVAQRPLSSCVELHGFEFLCHSLGFQTKQINFHRLPPFFSFLLLVPQNNYSIPNVFPFINTKIKNMKKFILGNILFILGNCCIIFLLFNSRNMIHELLKNENLDDFNYVHFMEKYNLTTICDETFVKNEYLKLKRY